MNSFIDTIPACDKKCDLCGRTHRDLKINGGLWLGAKCMDDLRFAHRCAQSCELSGANLENRLLDFFSARRARQLLAAMA